MKWSLQQLYRYNNTPLEFSYIENYDEYVKNYGDIIKLDDVKIEGKAYCISDDKYQFNLHIETIMYLEDARTLEEVKLPIDLNIKEIFTTDERIANDEIRYVEKNTIDLYDIVWEDIILEKPIRVIKDS